MPFTITHWMIWVALFALFALVELMTSQMVSIWFSVGALASAIVAVVTDGEHLVTEIVVFAVVTALVLALTRPFVKKVTRKNPVPTNKDALIDEDGVVTVHISNADNCGEVKVKGVEWTARTEKGAPDISFGTQVTVKRIEGVKLIVVPKV